MTTRRKYLIADIGGMTGTSGCLRLAENSDTAEGQGRTTGESTQQNQTTPSQAQSNRTEYLVERFGNNYIDANGLLEGEQVQIRDAQTGDFLDIDVSWNGSQDIFTRQSFARYSFEVIEEGTTIAQTGERILPIGYQFAVQQTQDSLFVTYHPSVQPSWQYEVNLFNPTNEYTVTPEIRVDEGVFELPFADAGIEDESYKWKLNITPTDSGEDIGPTIELGVFEDSLIAVGSDSEMTGREETINYVGQFAEQDVVSVQPPQTEQSDGLVISAGGGHSGTNGPQRSEFLSTNLNIRCRPEPIKIGGDTNRRFRINNLTTNESLEFTPR